MKKLLLFDLDGTLTKSRQVIERDMVMLLSQLVQHIPIAIVTGCAFHRIHEQLLEKLPHDVVWENIILFPSTSSCCYVFRNGSWECIYEEVFSEEEKAYIMGILLDVCKSAIPHKPFGDVIEDRGGQIALALLGLDAPLWEKERFDPDNRKRLILKKKLDKALPCYEVIIGGTTTISVTKKGIDKAHCLTIIKDIYGIEEDDMLYVGDALYKKGNDYPLLAAGVACISVLSPEDTRAVLKKMLIEVGDENAL